MTLLKRPYFLLFLISSLVFQACQDEKAIKPEIQAIALEADVDRFDQKFAQASEADIPALKAEYPSLFPQQYPDEFWLAKKRDTLLQALNEAVQVEFPEFDSYTDELTLLFKHLKFYFPNFEPPKVYTVISEVDYKDPVLSLGSEMIIGLDNYLGAEHPFYQGIPLYISANMKADQILPDVADLISRTYVPPANNRSFIGQMVYHGKLLYLKSLLLPQTTEANLIGYSEVQWQWAEDNEIDIWRYFIENEVLYDTEPKLLNQFINPAPFSKFYLEIDNESPGRIGRFMGWKMVKAYAENNDASLSEILTIPADLLYQQSKYKPKK